MSRRTVNPFAGLTSSEAAELVLAANSYSCPTTEDENGRPTTHKPGTGLAFTDPDWRGCEDCAAILVLCLIVQQNDTGNSVTKLARWVLGEYFPGGA